MSDNAAASRKLREWQRRFRRMGSHGPSPRALAAVRGLMTASTITRMREGVDPRGRGHQRLDPDYVEEKRKSGYSERIWQRTGESLRKVRSFVRGRTVRTVIDTPWSGDANAVRPVVGLSTSDVAQIESILIDDAQAQLEGRR